MSDPLLSDVDEEVCVLFCTEAGQLERGSLALAHSIRARGGRFARLPLYSFQPRAGEPIARETRRQFSELEVVHIEAPLNGCLPNFGLANKPHVVSWAERHLPHRVFVVMDSDTLVLREPSAFDLPSDVDVLMSPEPMRLAGTTDEDENAGMWDSYERCLGIDTPPTYLTTAVGNEKIRSYYNSGLVVFRRDLGLGRAWHNALVALVDGGVVPPDSRSFFTEQIALTLAIRREAFRLDELPPEYNYHLPFHAEMSDERKLSSLDEVVVAHYHRLFDRPSTRDPLHRIAAAGIRADDPELSAILKQCRVLSNPLREPIWCGRRYVGQKLVQAARKLGLRRDQTSRLQRS